MELRITSMASRFDDAGLRTDHRGWICCGALARMVEGYSRRPQSQERLTVKVADALHEKPTRRLRRKSI
jgi:hypothetical protein